MLIIRRSSQARHDSISREFGAPAHPCTDDLFKINAGIVYGIAEAAAKSCPKVRAADRAQSTRAGLHVHHLEPGEQHGADRGAGLQAGLSL